MYTRNSKPIQLAVDRRKLQIQRLYSEKKLLADDDCTGFGA